jgi:hypothetical protein
MLRDSLRYSAISKGTQIVSASGAASRPNQPSDFGTLAAVKLARTVNRMDVAQVAFTVLC